MRLDQFENSEFSRGKPLVVEVLWRLVEGILFNSWLPGSAWRCATLRLFDAKVGRGVVIKPHVRIKFPWRLTIGDHCWIGESVWVDNLAEVSIGSHVCISQGVYICTGSHRWDKETFDLQTGPVTIRDKAWLCANATVAPGASLGEGCVLTMNSLAVGECEDWSVYAGIPAVLTRQRTFK